MQLPQHFQEWKYCIEIKCGIALTKSFIQQRIKALSDNANLETKNFKALYGNDYKQQIIEWFRQAYLII